MCFSAEASFITSAGLTVVGLATLQKVKLVSQLPFAFIPIIFAIQQFTEGFVWLSMTDIDYAYLHKIPIRIFLIFAQVFWPIWVPFAIFFFEKEEGRKKVLLIFLGMGICFSAYLSFCIFTYDMNAVISNYHIRYTIEIPHWSKMVGGIFYFVPTVISPFVSSIRRMQFFGLFIFISYIITILFFESYVVSVWCFFAAIISVVIFSIVKNAILPKPDLFELV